MTKIQSFLLFFRWPWTASNLRYSQCFSEFSNKFSLEEGCAPPISFEVAFARHRAAVLLHRSQPADWRPFWLAFTNSLLESTTHLFVSPPPVPTAPPCPLFPRTIAPPAHPAGRPARKRLHCGRRRRGVCLQSVQRCPASHPVDQTRGKERQQIRARRAALSQGPKGEDFLNPEGPLTGVSRMRSATGSSMSC